MQQAEHHAQATTGMILQFKCNDLFREHEAAVQSLKGLPLHSTKEPPSLAQLRALGHQEWWAQVHKGPGQLPPVIHRQMRHVARPPDIDDAATLHRFFMRTARQL
jgi:hypothetical protein